jgi:hypothetical protein
MPDMSKTASDWSAAWFEGVNRWYGDTARFVSDRLEHDRKTLERLAGCKTFAEIAEVQQAWAGKCAEAYAQEGRRMLERTLTGAAFLSPMRSEEHRPSAG